MGFQIGYNRKYIGPGALLSILPFAYFFVAPLSYGHEMNLEWQWVDELQSPSLKNQDRAPSQRSIGLKKAELTLEWKEQGVGAEITLRPDAHSGSSETSPCSRRFDSRLGKQRHQKPCLKVLDAYHIDLHLGSSLRIGYGVWQNPFESTVLVPTLLEPSTNVQLPSGFSGAELLWNSILSPIPENPRKGVHNIQASIHSIEGRDDRNERSNAKSKNVDQAPTAEDPWIGAAFRLRATFSNRVHLDTALGQITSNYGTDTYTETFYKAFTGFTARGWKMSLEYRKLDEVSETSDNLNHESLNWRVQVPVSTTGIDVVSSLAYGFMEVPDDLSTDRFTSISLEMGVLQRIANGAFWQLSLGQEERTGDQDIGFQYPSGTKGVVRRASLGFGWHLGRL